MVMFDLSYETLPNMVFNFSLSLDYCGPLEVLLQPEICISPSPIHPNQFRKGISNNKRDQSSHILRSKGILVDVVDFFFNAFTKKKRRICYCICDADIF